METDIVIDALRKYLNKIVTIKLNDKLMYIRGVLKEVYDTSNVFTLYLQDVEVKKRREMERYPYLFLPLRSISVIILENG
ncbi:MAG TPA: hypothetical protein ENG34_00955 [Candidatus Aenigmarchaeota archaeon]|nr:hypothetical protein [Candidatus Aenigmarchaeota archaeon]